MTAGLLMLWMFMLNTLTWAQTPVSVEYRIWHPVILDFHGPRTHELADNPNPFLDYRLQVVFTDPENRPFSVPGYYAGDGMGGAVGDVWRVKFAPDRSGDWTWKASFRQGAGVAVEPDADAGVPVAFDGATGVVHVREKDPEAPGFYRVGRLESVGERYLKFRDGGFWIKGGADSPENFLGYVGFDGAIESPIHPEWVHTFDAHVADWSPGDPDWGDGRGKGIIGVLNFLASLRVNSVYLLLMNIGGDGCDVHPYAGPVDPKGSPENDNLHFDISKLEQWDIVFNHAQRLGINLVFVLNEGEEANKKELDNGTLGVERKLYYREMIARFGHYPAKQWMLCEEYDHPEWRVPPGEIIQWAEYMKRVDPYNTPVTVHNVNREESYDCFWGAEWFDCTSYQFAKNHSGQEYSDHTELLMRKAEEAGRPIPIHIDETITTALQDNEEYLVIDHRFYKQHVYGQSHIRKNVIWPIYLSGGSLELILQNLLATDDFRPYEPVWRYMSTARMFLEELPFHRMKPMDDLLRLSNGRGDVLALPGRVYVVYYPNARETGQLYLTGYDQAFAVRWFDPRAGQFTGSMSTIRGDAVFKPGPPPDSPEEDWIVLISQLTHEDTSNKE